MSTATSQSQHQAGEQAVGVVVLGMHRSGTSLASHLFGSLGCDFGGELMPAKADNAGGFWEHAEIVGVHDDFLAEMGRTWSDPRPWRAEDFETTAADRARQRLQEIFARDFQQSRRWVLKDPRHCRLLPLWRPVFDSCGHRVTFFHMTRNPLSIARSLQVRNGFSRSSSMLLWLRHVVEAERFTRGHPRSWVAFEALARDPVASIRTACTRMGIVQHFDFDAAPDRVSDAVKEDRIHHLLGNGELPDWSWAKQARRALLELLDGESSNAHASLDHLAAELRSADGMPHFAGSVELLGLFAQERSLRSHELEREGERARGHLTKLEADVANLQGELAQAKQYVTKLEGDLADATRYRTSLEREIAKKEAFENELSDYVRKLEDDLKRLTS